MPFYSCGFCRGDGLKEASSLKKVKALTNLAAGSSLWPVGEGF